MRTRIYLEGVNLDLYEDLDTTFTYVIDDIKSFGSRNTSFSKTITIPGNEVNNKAFGHVFNLGASNFYTPALDNIGYNFNPSVSARCIVFIDNIQVFKGSLRLTEIIDTAGELQYQCFLFGELGGLMFELGNRRLQDLDFSDYDMVYSLANISGSWDTVTGSGVVFPLVDYGNVSTDKVNFQYKAFRPALFVREYIERIISNTTYTVESNYLLSSIFDRLIIPHNQKKLTKISSNFLSATPKPITYNSVGANFPLEFTSSSLGSFTLNTGDTEFANMGSSITTNLTFLVTGLWSAGGYATINLRKNGISIGSTYLGASGSTMYFSKTVTAYAVTIATSDIITITFNWSPSQAYTLEIFEGSLQLSGGVPTSVEVNIDEALPINDTIPRGIFQKDFLISVIKMFNMYVYESPFDEKKILITPFNDFYVNSSTTALNWTNKVDRSQPIRSVPMSELNARYYQYKFKEDNDFYNEDYRKAYNEGYGDRIYDTQFEFSKDTDTLEIIFANSVLYKNIGTDKVYPAIYKLSGTTETPMDHVIRIVQAKKLTATSYNILNGATVLGAKTSYLYGGHVDDPVTPANDICFGSPETLQFTTSDYPTANLFNAFHSTYISEITDKDSKLVICKMYLNTVDIMNLDFAKLIYIDGVLFRLNKIANYNPVDLGTTEVQLLKVIDL